MASRNHSFLIISKKSNAGLPLHDGLASRWTPLFSLKDSFFLIISLKNDKITLIQ